MPEHIFGVVLSYEAILILIGIVFPGSIRMSRNEIDFEISINPLMFSKLFAIIASDSV